MPRRSAFGVLAGLFAAGVSACGSSKPSGPDDVDAPEPAGPGGRFGAEWESHARTYMAWPAQAAVWGRYLDDVRADIATLAREIAEYEPVVMLARDDQRDAAQRACGGGVEVIPLAVDDLWARDTVPVFVEQAGRVVGVDLNFNGWGDKQRHDNDGPLGQKLLSRYEIPRHQAPFVAEGGALETDGEGTLIVTESSLVNDNRNPGKSRDQLEAELKQTFGIEKVIWCAGVRGEDFTDAHIDCLVRYVAPGVVLLDTAFPGSPVDSWSRSGEQARQVLAQATDARGRALEVIDLPQPDPAGITGEGDDFVSSYANFYLANGAVFLPEFGDRQADDRAQGILRDHLPGRDVVAVPIDEIAAGGGGIHCSTHDQPGTPSR
ncbi:agmatine deiminase [Nocardia tenerifensis]|uniref:Agmatine deiminase n=1 Tax=Nocardia tenerifensis TaxID=228006 RepID=A0A318KB69_9NOCA|nr:agmatine deiminase family protein [Nocardia tenerifensis]PXX67035.1 agmatine deiminase [Nocardia tenerifensis]